MTPEVFKAYGLDEESLKKYWTGTGKNEKRERLKETMASRLREGIDSSLKDWKIWWAVDLAYDASFNQTTPTLVAHLMSKKFEDSAAVLDALKTWGLDLAEIVREGYDSKGQKITIIDIPAFFRILIPLVKAYTTIRRAKLFNDRNLYPFLKYEPTHFTASQRVVCEIVTDVVQRMTSQFGYASILKQIILQTLQYGTCVMFPMEEWYCETQISDPDGTEQCVREGLRYHMPHPTRFAIDNNHRPSTTNTDTGVEWGLYWRVDRYSNVADNPKYWNTDTIPFGANSLVSAYPQYFQEIYPCSMSFPKADDSGKGAGESDRERKVTTYAVGERDKGIVVTEYFQKVTPKDWGMGTYPYPVWMRFVVAADSTVLWCSPFCYHPMIFFGYDTDENRSRNASMGLEVLPFQDMMGNLLSQQILSVKQNLTKAVFYDTDQIDQDAITHLENLGQRRYQGVQMIPFSGRKGRIAGNDVRAAFHKVDFPIQNVGELAQTMSQIISILERILVLSSQEIGQQGTHEQTAEETRIIASNTSTRVSFTGSFIDDGIDAWKKQIYTAARAYMDEEQLAQVAMNDPESEQAIKDLGFTVKEKFSAPGGDPKVKGVVKAKMSGLSVETFVSTREGESRINSPQVAGAISQILQVGLNNQMTAEAMGPKQALDLITQAAQLGGIPKDFKMEVSKEYLDNQKRRNESYELRMEMEKLQAEAQKKQLKEGPPPSQGQPQQQPDIGQIAKQIEQQTLQVVTQQIAAPLAEHLKQAEQRISQDEAAIGKLFQKLQAIEQAVAQASQPPPEQPMPQELPEEAPVGMA